MLGKKLREKWKRTVLLLGCMALVFSGCGKTGDVNEAGSVGTQNAAEQTAEATETTETQTAETTEVTEKAETQTAEEQSDEIAGKNEKSAETKKNTSKKPAADKGKKMQSAEPEKDKTVVAEVAEAKQQPEEKNTQKSVQNNDQQAAQQPEENNSQKTEEKDNQQPEQKPEQKPDQQPEQKQEQPAVKDPAKDPAYHLVWQDEFDGTELDRSDWNVELHDPGWVNSELQAYVDTEENIYVKDGKLIIQPEKTEQNGKVSYTSGRVNTQGKKDFKYGYFECRAKVPQGTGYLPAFWMMPTNENLYGQWPKCGEIDIMEVMGQQTNKLYGTIHYGEPHAES